MKNWRHVPARRGGPGPLSCATCKPALYARHWIVSDIVPSPLSKAITHQPRGAYSLIEAQAVVYWVALRSPEYGQALRFILASGARINETLQLRADKVFLADGQVELLDKGGRILKIPVLHAEVLHELDLSARFVYLPAERGWRWKDRLERYVRQSCDTLGIQRLGVHGFRATRPASSSISNARRDIPKSRRVKN